MDIKEHFKQVYEQTNEGIRVLRVISKIFCAGVTDSDLPEAQAQVEDAEKVFHGRMTYEQFCEKYNACSKCMNRKNLCECNESSSINRPI